MCFFVGPNGGYIVWRLDVDEAFVRIHHPCGRCDGFSGPILPVNPRAAAVHGIMAYKDAASLPMAPDLAIIATPPDSVPDLIAELGARGTRAAVVLTAGFAEGELAVGRERAAKLLAAAQPHLLRVVGPNCLGIAVPSIGLNATFAPAG